MRWKRTHHCGQLRAEHDGTSTVLMGWIYRRREHKNVIFLDLRDREGITQLTLDTQQSDDFQELAPLLRPGTCIGLQGEVVLREKRGSKRNAQLATGDIEVIVNALEVYSTTETLPFPLEDETDATELTRLRYRYLDLRRSPLLNNLRIRSAFTREIRNYLDEKGFLDIETPILMKSTPEGARDYLVPSRQDLNSFYALPQSPQLYKQLLMIGGIERYYQIARCFRDEDLRADRQPEFTQIDLEMSFVDESDIYPLMEGMMQRAFQNVLNIELPDKFPHMSYAEAMERYGEDKPDIRFGFELINATEVFKGSGFRAFQGAHIKGIRLPGEGGRSRSWISKLEKMVKKRGAKGLAWLKRKDGTWDSPIGKFLSEEEQTNLHVQFGTEDGDLVLMIADASLSTVNDSLSTLRRHLIIELDAKPQSEWGFVWIDHFPLVEYNEDTGECQMLHHAFTMPHPEDLEKLESEPGSVRSLAYDLVLNGFELGSGSIRIHDQSIQERVFGLLNLPPEEAESRFGFFLEALKYGAPPHGGMALGLDRIIMLIVGAESLRDVIAFPKTQTASCPMSGAPGPVEIQQLTDVHIQLLKTETSSPKEKTESTKQ